MSISEHYDNEDAIRHWALGILSGVCHGETVRTSNGVREE
jgi:hypothetical protein